ncbi:acyl-CoA dehydrogenase family protein [Pseudomonas extremaustralis]|uniref:acyl-CoA dehydrogenase family protein n=1 Tax=Pseudomonas extremaustralis TaxID=359110 RepID=UPI002AA0CD22|nr:acyl-CoA dehydrogenase family protein [Pseudomonas extremaustralis]
MNQPSLRSVEVANFEALLERLSAELASTAQRYDESGAFPHANFQLLHEHGLLALTVPKALGGGGAGLSQARKAISAIAKGEPSTALTLVMQYLQHTRLQDSKTWPQHLRKRVAEDAVRNGALINALRVEPDLGTPARGGLPATTAVRTADGWRISGRKIYSTGSHDVLFDNVLVPLDHAVSVSPWSTPQPELDGEGLLWMSVLLSSVYDAVELAIEACGNPGLSRHSPLQRHYRDVLCSRVHTPQNDAILQGVGKAVFAQRQKERT